jgi:hypothetical protein
MKNIMLIKEPVHYWKKGAQSGNGMLQYWTEMSECQCWQYPPWWPCPAMYYMLKCLWITYQGWENVNLKITEQMQLLPPQILYCCIFLASLSHSKYHLPCIYIFWANHNVLTVPKLFDTNAFCAAEVITGRNPPIRWQYWLACCQVWRKVVFF